MLPPEYREGLCADGGTGVFWLTAYYGRMVAYLPGDWEKVTEQLSRIPMPSPRLSHFKTKVMGLAQELQCDAQGRVPVPTAIYRLSLLDAVPIEPSALRRIKRFWVAPL